MPPICPDLNPAEDLASLWQAFGGYRNEILEIRGDPFPRLLRALWMSVSTSEKLRGSEES
ncbi:hypothetical protein NQZ68_014196 [Dissostichus eleginoides]|nr:hypothetical protein NQZ68_014196 [Dissostichus eleginoides]